MVNRSDMLDLVRSEQDRNRLLRRADWRFLLPDSRSGKSVCFGDGLFWRSLAEISSQVVRPEAAQPGECDLAAVVDPDLETIQAAWRLLKPGGWIYAEWRSLQTILQAGGKNGIGRLTESAGFTCLRGYWAWPPPERFNPSFWLPLDAPQALEFFLRNRPRPASFRERVKRRLLQPAWRLGLRAQFLAPLSLTAYKPQPPGAMEEPEHRLLLTGGAHSTNKVVALVFDGNGIEPRLALKFPRTPDSIPSILREKQTLQAIEADGLGSGACLPKVVYINDRDGQTVLAETPVVGQPLYTFINKNSYRSLALKVTGWLSGLAQASRPIPHSDWWERIAAPALADFERSFGPVVSKDELGRTHSALEMLGDLPLTCEQRDCSPWNLLIASKGELAVLDWESAEVRGLPGLDLIYFLTYLAFFHERALESGKTVEAYRRAQDPGTFTGQVQAECEHKYLETVGLKPESLQPLRLLAWLIHSHSEYQRISTGTSGQPGASQLRSRLFYRLWRAELDQMRASGSLEGIS